MYRSQGSAAASFGVHAGPYTGARRTIALADLPDATRRRLADATHGRGSAPPILARAAHASPVLWPLGAIAGGAGLAGLALTGFGAATSELALQGSSYASAYAVCGALLGVAAIAVRGPRRGPELAVAPGVYVLPLDLVEVTAETVSVLPLGELRTVEERVDGRVTAMVLRFSDETVHVFGVSRSEAAAARTLLDRAQAMLERLTVHADLADAFASDVFYDLRADDWAGLATSMRPAPRRARRPLVLGAAVGAALGIAALAARDRASDDFMFARAVEGHEAVDYERYLAVGHRHDDEARRALAELAEHALVEKRDALTARMPPASLPLASVPDASLGEAERIARHERHDACVDAYRQRATTDYPGAVGRYADILAYAARTGDPELRVRFDRRSTLAFDALTGHVDSIDDAALRAREDVTIRALRAALSEVCPTSIVTLARDDGAAPRPGAPVLSVVYRVDARPGSGALAGYAAVEIAFDVGLRTAAGKDGPTFLLTMPPPTAPSIAVRDSSLFTIASHPPSDLALLPSRPGDEHATTASRPGGEDETASGPGDEDETASGPGGEHGDPRVYESMSARAFDRLFDELYSLFFRGDPRVVVPAPDSFE